MASNEYQIPPSISSAALNSTTAASTNMNSGNSTPSTSDQENSSCANDNDDGDVNESASTVSSHSHSSNKRGLSRCNDVAIPSSSSPSSSASASSSKPRAPPTKKRKKNGTAHTKLIEEFAQRSHVRNAVNLSSYHGKKQNIKTLCPYHDMLPVINIMEKEVFNNHKESNSIKKEYCNILPIIRNHCEWCCSGSPYKLECRNLLMRAKELYEYEFDFNDVALPFMDAVVLGGPNPNICIKLNEADEDTKHKLVSGQFEITFKPLQNLSLLERNDTCNIALKAISCGTFKRNLQPVPDACRITKLLDGDGCFVTVHDSTHDINSANPSNASRLNKDVFFKVSTCEVRQRRKLQGTDSVLGVGFDCASRLSWQKPRIYWMHQSIHSLRDKKTKKVIEKKHISNRDLRFSLLVPHDFKGSMVIYMIGIQQDVQCTVNTSIPCKRYGTTAVDDHNLNGLNSYTAAASCSNIKPAPLDDDDIPPPCVDDTNAGDDNTSNLQPVISVSNINYPPLTPSTNNPTRNSNSNEIQNSPLSNSATSTSISGNINNFSNQSMNNHIAHSNVQNNDNNNNTNTEAAHASNGHDDADNDNDNNGNLLPPFIDNNLPNAVHDALQSHLPSLNESPNDQYRANSSSASSATSVSNNGCFPPAPTNQSNGNNHNMPNLDANDNNNSNGNPNGNNYMNVSMSMNNSQNGMNDASDTGGANNNGNNSNFNNNTNGNGNGNGNSNGENDNNFNNFNGSGMANGGGNNSVNGNGNGNNNNNNMNMNMSMSMNMNMNNLQNSNMCSNMSMNLNANSNANNAGNQQPFLQGSVSNVNQTPGLSGFNANGILPATNFLNNTTSTPYNAMNGMNSMNNMNAMNGMNGMNTMILNQPGTTCHIIPMNNMNNMNGMNGMNMNLMNNNGANSNTTHNNNGNNNSLNMANMNSMNGVNGMGNMSNFNSMNNSMSNLNAMNGMNSMNGMASMTNMNNLNNTMNGVNSMNNVNNMANMTNMNGMGSMNGMNGNGNINNMMSSSQYSLNNINQPMMPPDDQYNGNNTANNGSNDSFNNQQQQLPPQLFSDDTQTTNTDNGDKSKFIDDDLEHGRKNYLDLMRSIDFGDEDYQTCASKWIRICLERYTENEDVYNDYLLHLVQSLIDSIGDEKTVRGLKRCWMSYNNIDNEWSFLHMICSQNLLYLFQSILNMLSNYKHALFIAMSYIHKDSKLKISPLYCCITNHNHQFTRYLFDYYLNNLQSPDMLYILQNGFPNQPSNSLITHLINYDHVQTLQQLLNMNASRSQSFLTMQQINQILQKMNGQKNNNMMSDTCSVNAFSK